MLESEEGELHDLSDDSDYAASLNQGLGGSIRQESGEMGGGGLGFDEGADYEVVFLKDNVAIHPTQFTSRRISGRLRLAKQGSVSCSWNAIEIEIMPYSQEPFLYIVVPIILRDLESNMGLSPLRIFLIASLFGKLSLVWGKPRQRPLGSEEWASFLDTEGRIMDSKALRKRIFYGEVEYNLRKEVWKFCWDTMIINPHLLERDYIDSVKRSEYETLKFQWQSISSAQAKRFTKFRERRGLIEKDVVRTDRSVSYYDGDDNPHVALLHDILLTYSFYNFDLGYCQGTRDLLSPILFVMEDEAESFWCFVALMERLGPNFNQAQNGMHTQLFALSKVAVFESGRCPVTVAARALQVPSGLPEASCTVALAAVVLANGTREDSTNNLNGSAIQNGLSIGYHEIKSSGD